MKLSSTISLLDEDIEFVAVRSRVVLVRDGVEDCECVLCVGLMASVRVECGEWARVGARWRRTTRGVAWRGVEWRVAVCHAPREMIYMW